MCHPVRATLGRAKSVRTGGRRRDEGPAGSRFAVAGPGSSTAERPPCKRLIGVQFPSRARAGSPGQQSPPAQAPAAGLPTSRPARVGGVRKRSWRRRARALQPTFRPSIVHRDGRGRGRRLRQAPDQIGPERSGPEHHHQAPPTGKRPTPPRGSSARPVPEARWPGLEIGPSESRSAREPAARRIGRRQEPGGTLATPRWSLLGPAARWRARPIPDRDTCWFRGPPRDDAAEPGEQRLPGWAS